MTAAHTILGGHGGSRGKAGNEGLRGGNLLSVSGLAKRSVFPQKGLLCLATRSFHRRKWGEWCGTQKERERESERVSVCVVDLVGGNQPPPK